jgi:hypothetical protein
MEGWKECWKEAAKTNIEGYLGICSEVLRKTTESINQDDRLSGRNSYRATNLGRDRYTSFWLQKRRNALHERCLSPRHQCGQVV